MYTATVLTNPAATLDAATVAALRDAFGGGEAVWLNPGVAAEFEMPEPPENLGRVWNGLQGEGVDLVVQPSANRRKRLLIADMDSTMIRQECIDELAEAAGVGAAVRAVTERAMAGDLDFEAALRERVALLEGLPETVIGRVLAERISMTPGGAVLVATMKAHGAHAALVSGGFACFAAPVAARLGFDEYRANALEIEAGALTGRASPPILGRRAKVDALRDLTARLELRAGDVLAIGDGANDLGMLAAAGAGVAVCAKPAVQARVRHRVNHGDLTALLHIQGYGVADFVAP